LVGRPVSRKFSRQSSALKVRTTAEQPALSKQSTFALDSSSAPYLELFMSLLIRILGSKKQEFVKYDFVNRTAKLSIEDHEAHWHREYSQAKISKLAAAATIIICGLVASFAYSKSSPAHSAQVAVCSLVDEKGGE